MTKKRQGDKKKFDELEKRLAEMTENPFPEAHKWASAAPIFPNLPGPGLGRGA